MTSLSLGAPAGHATHSRKEGDGTTGPPSRFTVKNQKDSPLENFTSARLNFPLAARHLERDFLLDVTGKAKRNKIGVKAGGSGKSLVSGKDSGASSEWGVC